MSEYHVGWVATGRLLLVVAFATLYWLGGRRHKWLRRYVGGIGFPLGVIALASTRVPLYICLLTTLSYPLFLSFGYGSLTRNHAWIRRFIFGTGLALAALPFAVVLHTWEMWAAQLGLSWLASLWLGLRNPVDAAEEETLIAALSVVLVPFLV